jgi:pseudaminic acid cytidylyltransferase
LKRVAIIPARGGSKRIPRKNIRNFLGKPIIAYSIEAALASGLFEEVMVSTDDEEIAAVAKEFGARVPFMRSKENADDFATTVNVIKEVLADYQELKGETFEYGCCIYPTAPFTSPEALKEGFHKMEAKQFDTVFPVVAFSYPVWRGLKLREEKIEMVWPENLNTRSQDLEKVYHDAGQWYWFAIPKLKDSLFTAHSGYVELDEKKMQDIDTESDWQLAELKFRL